MTGESVHRWIVDAIEEEAAAVEVDGTRVVFVPVFLLPSRAKEGDVLRVLHTRETKTSRLTIEFDEEGREELLARSREQGRRARGGGGGDVEL